MRVITGTLKGRGFEAPKSSRTHPMSDKMRGAIFNMLGDIDGLTVLDPFAGSGALSFEAVSRGASSAIAIEVDKTAHRVLQANVQALGVGDRVKAIRANCTGWSTHNEDKLFDLILADPPYDDLRLSTLDKISKHLKSTGVMVVSYPGREAAPTVNGVVVVDNRNYGDAALATYRHE